MIMKKLKTLILAAAFVLIGAGCATAPSPNASTTSPTPAPADQTGGDVMMEEGMMKEDAMMEGDEMMESDDEAMMEGDHMDDDAMMDDSAMMDDHGSVTVSFDGKSFSPSDVTVDAGTTVVFRNDSTSPFWPASNMHPTHTLYDGTSLSQHCASGSSFDACGSVAPGETFSFNFEKVGTWRYHDHLHANRGGSVTVK